MKFLEYRTIFFWTSRLVLASWESRWMMLRWAGKIRAGFLNYQSNNDIWKCLKSNDDIWNRLNYRIEQEKDIAAVIKSVIKLRIQVITY